MIEKNKYIVVKGSSGLGNRILALSTTVLYGRMTKRKVVVDWRDGSYSDNQINSFFVYFDCSSALNVNDLPVNVSVYPSLWHNRLDESFGGLKHKLNITEGEMSIDVSKLDYTEDILVFCSYSDKTYKMRSHFQGDFQYLSKLTNIEIISTILKKELQLKQDIQARVDKFASSMLTQPTLGVHVRYTDMKIDLGKLYQRVENTLRKNKQYQIFLATDSQKVIQDFQQQFPKVVTTDKWFPSNESRLHQNWSECSNRIENGKEALVDLYLLAKCDRLIYSSASSFGLVASLLSSQPKHQIVDIEKLPFYQRIWLKLRKI